MKKVSINIKQTYKMESERVGEVTGEVCDRADIKKAVILY